MADVAELLVTARRALARGDNHKALPLLRQAATLEPNLFGTQMLLGICLTACGDAEEGLAALRGAVRLNPDSAPGHYNLAAALRDAGHPQEAQRHFEAALRVQPDYTAADAALKALRSGTTPEVDGWPRTEAAQPRTSPSASTSSAATTPASTSTDRPRRQPARPRVTRPARTAQPRAVSPTGRWLIVAAAAVIVAIGAAGLPPPSTSASYLVWSQRGDFSAVRFAPDGATLIGAGAGVTVWGTETGQQVSAFPREGEAIVDLDISPDGSVLACSAWGESRGASVTLRRVADGAVIVELPATAGRKPVAISPDGSRLALGTDYMGTAHPLGVQIWSVPAGELVRALGQSAADDGIGYIAALAFSEDGARLASGDDAGVIRVYQAWDGARVKTISTEEMCLTALAFMPTGELAYAGTSGPHVILCALPEGNAVASLVGDERATGRLGLPPAVTDIDVSPDGRLLAVAEATRDLARIEVFDLETQSLLATAEALAGLPARAATGDSADVRCVRFSPDGRHLAWCGSSGVAVASVQRLLGERG